MKRTAVFSSLLCLGIVFSCHSARADLDGNCGRLKAGDNFNRINEILDCIESKIRTSLSPVPPEANSEASGSPSLQDKAGLYRITTEYVGQSNVEFQVFVNDLPVAAYSSDGANADITRFIRPGQNRFRILWTADPAMPGVYAKLIVSEKTGDRWSALITREVTKNTKAGESTLNLFAGSPPK
jgi:hypothetical protein